LTKTYCKILYYNVKGIKNKKSDFFEDLYKLDAEIICFSETLCTYSYTHSFFQEHDYSQIEIMGTKTKKKGRCSGGLLIFFKNNLDIITLELSQDFCILKFKTKIIIFVYIPPGNIIVLQNTLNMIQKYLQQHQDLIVMGDFNSRIGDSNLNTITRKSSDLIINPYGAKLIDYIEEKFYM